MANGERSDGESEGAVVRSRFDELLGTQWISDDPEDARVRVEVREDLFQPVGLVHGGVFSSRIESVCSRATALAVFPEGNVAMAQSITVSFLRPITAGAVEVSARARHRGRTTWIWQADVIDADGRLCAAAQMTVAVRPLER